MKFIIAIALISQISIAADIALIPKGQKAPFSGLLIDPATAKRLDSDLVRMSALRSAIDSQTDMLIDAQRQKLVLEFERDGARAQLKEQSWISGIWWFVLGAIIAGSAK